MKAAMIRQPCFRSCVHLRNALEVHEKSTACTFQKGRQKCYSTQTENKITTVEKKKPKRRMKAWYIYQYGGNEELTLSEEAKIPEITSPKDLLIEIQAASVNPIDVVMRGGYGRNLINKMRTWLGRGSGSEFPLTLGRDFSGIVRQTGHLVTRYKPGDEVWGALAGQRQGTHAQFCIAGENEISKKPSSLSHIEAASLPYVATTTWAALITMGHMRENSFHDKRVLIHGGSGGIGTFAVQLIKAWGGEVVATCSTDAVALVKHIGADHVIDYRTEDVLSRLGDIGKLDLILDPVGGEAQEATMKFLRPYHNYVTLVFPLLPNADKHGFLAGMAKSAVDLNFGITKGISKGLTSYRWAFFIPNGEALKKVAVLVDSGKIQPVIDKVFKLDELPLAYEKVEQKHGRGKTVIDMRA
ncbi:reticulon-4-interacting protein 1 homolog, mitochondrial-like [Dreissena polymorpha]|uniref:Enoyl reductase (ER) domain-containing protein n=1 Tax=Dreissena polymorpha TaxID=45954 RepID=A0A9D4D1E6_DREPO|nr:reticulon-4-interacting protein 1 homolog, mitochondrial-like [Dreissena polymorpha]XP_052240604.1 reticulon-4-interacting protein 1 homolog, mitochondrial-like [Dreissena polymorpha]KAH3736424.1 hypothetical protein DPMN_042987 [Dreissena polymorpha]